MTKAELLVSWALVSLVITALLVKPTPSKANYDCCKYDYEVFDTDWYSLGYTNEVPLNGGCIQTTTQKTCGTMLLKETIKGTEECLPKD